MIITDGEKVMTLQELAQKMCHAISNYDNDCSGCYDGSCPAEDYCRPGRNGMQVWLRKVVGENE